MASADGEGRSGPDKPPLLPQSLLDRYKQFYVAAADAGFKALCEFSDLSADLNRKNAERLLEVVQGKESMPAAFAGAIGDYGSLLNRAMEIPRKYAERVARGLRNETEGAP